MNAVGRESQLPILQETRKSLDTKKKTKRGASCAQFMGAPKNDFSVCEADDLAPSVNVTTQFTPGASVAVVGLKYHSLSHIYGVGLYHKPSPISH